MIFHTRWLDIKPFNNGSANYFLQGRRNRLTKRLSFRAVRVGNKTIFETCEVTLPELELAGLRGKR